MSLLPPDEPTTGKEAEINVTPMVDIMLVLLVIFMVAAPLMHGQIKIDLPQGGQKVRTPQKRITLLSLNASGDLYVGKDKITEAQVERTLKKTHHDVKKPLYLEADRALAYGKVVKLMDQLNKLGYKIALITEIKNVGR